MGSVTDILMQMAAEAGANARAKGAIYGNMVQQAANVPAQILDDEEKDAVKKQIQARLNAQDARGAAQDARQAAADQRDQAQQAEALKKQTALRAGIAAGWSGSDDPKDFDVSKAAKVVTAAGYPELAPTLSDFHAQMLPKLTSGAPGSVMRDQAGQVVPGSAIPPTKADYTIENQRFSGADSTPIGPLVPKPAAVPTVPALGSPADAVTRYAKENGLDPTTMTTAQVNTALKQHTDATQKTPILGGMNALYAQTDPKAIAAQIRASKMPPDISQYGRPVQGAIASELSKAGPNGEPPMDLASAQREWKAQLKLNSTMNGPQQVRLDESIKSGLAMYDKVDELATKWNGMGIGPLSRVNLAAARDGLKGQAAASIANQLTGQIGQLTSDVATIEQGGLTPTNESRAVADKSMQDWWGKGTITDMTAQGRYNMQIRHLARSNQQPMVPGNTPDLSPAIAATPAPVAAASGAAVTVTSPSGKPYPFPDQASADRFVADAKAKGLWK